MEFCSACVSPAESRERNTGAAGTAALQTAFWIFCVLLSVFDLSAAELNGKISGCISDDSGGGLPGVEVHIAGSLLQQAIQIYTDSGGCYQSSVPAGNYEMRFRLPGFRSEEKNDVIVYSGREAIVDRILRISLKAEVTVSGRRPLRDIVEESDNLIGVADSSSQGAVRYEQLALRPLLRPGELLETVPGVVISQHSGQGKANQYYLRGFNLDHGTDLAITVDGIPANFPSHGHGQGYSDLNFLIPELVNDVQFKKGPYYAEEGDFSSAGAIRIDYASSVNEKIAGIEGGNNEYARGLFISSSRIGKGNVLFALELFHNNGPWDHPDGYHKTNGLIRYTLNGNENTFSITGMGYAGSWNSTDQIPSRLIDTGFSRFGAIDPSDGGETSRYSLSANWRHSWKNALTEISAYRLRYRLHLFSNFTYFLNDPINGDQFEQSDDRNVTGAEVQQKWLGSWFDRNTENQVGLRLRNDDVDAVGLFLTNRRHRLETERLDRVAENSLSAYWQNSTTWFPKFRTTAGLRADYFSFDVRSNLDGNSHTISDTIVSPKLGFVLGPWRKTEFYVNYGMGFHSNDARTITTEIVPALVRSRGREWGLRSALVDKWQTTLSLWALDFDSELLFAGDSGTTEASRASRRSGLEWNNYFKPYRWMTAEVNWAYSRSRFRGHSEEGNRIPGAVEGVFTGGIWLEGLPLKLNPFQHTVGVIQTRAKPEPVMGNTFWSNLILGLQLRYFGPRPLTENNSVRAKSSTLVNLAIGYKLSSKWNGFLDIFNLLNSKSSDIDYYYVSRLPEEPVEGVAGIHTHPVEPLSFRFSVTRNF